MAIMTLKPPELMTGIKADRDPTLMKWTASTGFPRAPLVSQLPALPKAPVLKRLYPAMFKIDETNLFPKKDEDILKQLKALAEKDNMNFLIDLYQRKTSDADVKELFELMEIPPEVSEKVLSVYHQADIDEGTVNEIFKKLFPQYKPDEIVQTAEEDYEKFLQMVKSKGQNEDTTTVLRSLGYSDTEINQIFGKLPEQRMNEAQAGKLRNQKQQEIRDKYKAMGHTPVFETVFKPRVKGSAIDKAMTEQENSDWYKQMRAELKAVDDEYKAYISDFQYSPLGQLVKPSPISPDYVPGEMPSGTWLDRVEEIQADPRKLVPFLQSGIEFNTLEILLKTARDLEEGKDVSLEDLLRLQEYVEKAQRDTSWGYKVVDVLANLIPFAGEFLVTGGIYAAGEKIGTKVTIQALKKLLTKEGAKVLEKALVKYAVKVGGVIAGGTLRTIPAGITRIPAGTLEKQLQGTLTGGEEEVWLSLVKATGEQWVEVLSESTGGLFAPLTAPIKGQLVKMGLFKAFLKVNPTQKVSDIGKVFQKLGYHGVFEEMLEERVAEVGHGILYELGLGDQKFSIPSLEQLSIELVSFSVPGVAIKVAESLDIKGIVTSEAGGVTPDAFIPKKPTGAGEVTGKAVGKETFDLSYATKEIAETKVEGLKRQGFKVSDIEFKDGQYRVTVESKTLTKVPEMAPSTSVQTGLEGMGKEAAQVKMFEEVSGKEAGKVPITKVPQKVKIPEGQKVPDDLYAQKTKLEDQISDVTKKTTGGTALEREKMAEVREAKATKPKGYMPEQTQEGRDLAKRYDLEQELVHVDELIAKAEGIPTPEDVPTVIEKAELEKIPGSPKLTQKQTDSLLKQFESYLTSPSPENLRNMTIELRKNALAKRFDAYAQRVKELLNEGKSYEDSLIQARSELKGMLPEATTDMFDDLTESMRDALFSKVYHFFADKPREIGDMISTSEALSNALLGKSIPSVPGIKGGSAYSRLLRVFSDTPEIVKKLDTAVKENKTLRNIIEGEFKDMPEGGIPHVPVDRTMADYLGGLSTNQLQDVMSLRTPDEARGLFTFDPSGNLGFQEQGGQLVFGEKAYEAYKSTFPDGTPKSEIERALEAADLRSFITPTKGAGKFIFEPTGKLGLELQGAQAELGETAPKLTKLTEPVKPLAQRMTEAETLAAELANPPKDIADMVEYPAIAEVLKTTPLIPIKGKFIIIKALKEVGATAVDIGNALKGLNASSDWSHIARQGGLLAPGNPTATKLSFIETWKAMWSQKAADAAWYRVSRTHRLVPLYDEITNKFGNGDFLRPLTLPKGIARYKGVEEFGFTQSTRPIPKFMSKFPLTKVSERVFSTGINELTMEVWDKHYRMLLKMSEQYASGKRILKEGEVFSIINEMHDKAVYLSDVTGRGSLGKFANLAPATNAIFFSVRKNLGTILTPTHLFSPNPLIRKAAWKDMALAVGVIGGIEMVGAAAGLWELEDDPRSADFAKIRIGNTRLDPWWGMQQFVVLASRVITGEMVTKTGKVIKIDPEKAVFDFITGKEAPGLRVLWEVITGKTYIGEKVNWASPAQWVERIAPFTVTDIQEAWQDDPSMAIPAGVASFIGFGVQTYTGDWEDNIKRLGLPKYDDNLVYGQTTPVYDFGDFWSDTASQFSGVDPATLTEKKGFDPKVVAVVRGQRIIEQLSIIPNQKLTSIENVADYYNMWKDRQKLVASGDEAKLKEFDAKYPQAHLGNITQRQLSSLFDYSLITDAKKKTLYLTDHPELSQNPRDEWLKSHPEENALLAIGGHAKILTQKAYDKAVEMIKTLDIPDTAVEQYLPKETIFKSYMEYQDMVSQYGASSNKAKDVRRKNPEFDKWGQDNLGWQPVTGGTTAPSAPPSDLSWENLFTR